MVCCFYCCTQSFVSLYSSVYPMCEPSLTVWVVSSVENANVQHQTKRHFQPDLEPIHLQHSLTNCYVMFSWVGRQKCSSNYILNSISRSQWIEPRPPVCLVHNKTSNMSVESVCKKLLSCEHTLCCSLQETQRAERQR